MFQFGGATLRQGCFRTAKNKSGFLGHTCLAVSADGRRQPLGLRGMIPVVRLEGEAAKQSPGLTYGVELERWLDLVGQVEHRSGAGVELIHVMDSEGDAYWLLDSMQSRGCEFIVRLCQDRIVLCKDNQMRLSEAMNATPRRFTRTVKLTRQRGAKKTGCGYQARQLESLDALPIAFAMLAPVATQLLALRWVGRNEGERDAAEVLSDDQIAVLAITERQRGRPLPARPTVAQAKLAVALLGGFITNNKVPGWQILGRGMEDLRKMVQLLRGPQQEAQEM